MTDDDPGRVLSTVEDPTPRTEPLTAEAAQERDAEAWVRGEGPGDREEAAARATRQEAAPEPLREALAAAIHDRNIDSDANGCDHHADEYGTSLQCADEADSLLAHPSLRAVPSQAPDQGPARDTGVREALKYALNQWQMYADAERGPGPETRDNSEPGADYLTWLADGTDAEAQQYARCRAALSQGAAHEERGLDARVASLEANVADHEQAIGAWQAATDWSAAKENWPGVGPAAPDVQADIVQAATGGPDFTPASWPATPEAAPESAVPGFEKAMRRQEAATPEAAPEEGRKGCICGRADPMAGHCFDIDGNWWNGHGPATPTETP